MLRSPLRWAVAHDLAVDELDDAARARGDPGIVRDDDEGGAELAVQLLEERDDLGANLLIEVAGRLVAQEE
jgi:hypothetical protein